jgi:hypothetical protein
MALKQPQMEDALGDLGPRLYVYPNSLMAEITLFLRGEIPKKFQPPPFCTLLR